jgi:hypothetical protein
MKDGNNDMQCSKFTGEEDHATGFFELIFILFISHGPPIRRLEHLNPCESKGNLETFLQELEDDLENGPD